MSDQLPHDEELRSLYRRLPADEPRREIDEAILSAAREIAAREADEVARANPDAAAREHELQRRRFLARARWMLPLAAAASLILTVTLTRLTPERPPIETMALRESSDSAVAYGTAAPESREAEIAGEALEDAAPAREADAGRQRSESAAATAQAPVEAPKPAAEKPVAKDSALATAKTAGQASEEAAKQQTESSSEEARQLEARRLADQKKKVGSDLFVAPPSRRKLDEAKKAEAAPTAEHSAPAAPAPAAPPPNVAAPAAPPSNVVSPAAPPAEPAPPAEAAPAPPPVAALGSRDDAQRNQARESGSAARKGALVRQLGQRATTPTNDWPFGLAPGLDGAQACRALALPADEPCHYVEGVAVIQLTTARIIDRGELAGRKVTRITLFAPQGRLTKVALQVEGFTTEQILVAPPAR